MPHISGLNSLEAKLWRHAVHMIGWHKVFRDVT